jgi:feruloyl esterase
MHSSAPAWIEHDGYCMKRFRPRSRSVVIAVIVGTAAFGKTFASQCTNLTSMTIADTTITSASDVAAGTFTPSAAEAGKAPPPAGRVPAFCQVVGVARPTADSIIDFEVWMPIVSAWNGKFEGVGNGGYIGRISHGAMENAVNLGYATASTDTGHVGSDLSFAAGHPEKIVDWGYRAIHVTAEAAKLILHEYYGRFPEHSYFNGCSTGGGQALSEAQRYPDDYDGIIAGDAGNDRVHLNAAFLWAYAATHRDGHPLFSESKLLLINQAAIAACDAKDGLKDGVIADPLRCRFDPGVLLCHGAEGDDCLTSPQVEAVRKIYAGPHNPRTGELIIAGWSPGSESLVSGDYAGWKDYLLSGSEPARVDFWKYFVFDDPNWNWRTFDYDRDLAYADSKMAAVNASSAELQEYKSHGGKILMYHGWADPVGPPLDAIEYYKRVERTMGGTEKTRDFFRLFLVPGMSHCNGGPGYLLAGGARAGDAPDNVPKWPVPDPDHDVLSALDRWAEQGIAPERVIAAHRTDGVVDRTIPVCAYPLTASWDGKSNRKDASSFRCVDPHKVTSKAGD